MDEGEEATQTVEGRRGGGVLPNRTKVRAPSDPGLQYYWPHVTAAFVYGRARASERGRERRRVPAESARTKTTDTAIVWCLRESISSDWRIEEEPLAWGSFFAGSRQRKEEARSYRKKTRKNGRSPLSFSSLSLLFFSTMVTDSSRSKLKTKPTGGFLRNSSSSQK